MPTYVFKNKQTKEIRDFFMSFAEREEFVSKQDVWIQIPTAPHLITHTGSIVSKTSGDWKDLLKKIDKNAGKGSTVKNY